MRFDQGHALLIGVGTHQFHPGADVPISVADAEAIRAVLQDASTCGYPQQQVQVLHDGGATKQGILDALDSLAGRARVGDTVFLFFCGHGALGTDGNYYLVSHDARVANGRVVAGTGVSDRDLLDMLRAITAERLLVIFNACHSGHVSPALNLAETLETSNPPADASAALLATGQGRIIITACREGQYSYIGDGANTIFTQALVDGLRGRGVRNSNGFISAYGLYEHLYESVRAEAQEQVGKEQEPELTVLKGVGPFAVSLYRGATTPGELDANEPPPEDMAVREVPAAESQRYFSQRVVDTGGGAYVEGDVTAGGDFVGRDKTVHGDEVRGVKLSDVEGGIRGSTIAGGNVSNTQIGGVTVFDQRGQNVRYQYNVSGDINLSGAQDRAALIDQLEKLEAEIAKAFQGNALDEETATDAEYNVKKAAQQARKPEPDKNSILEYLRQANVLIGGVTGGAVAVQGLSTALTQAIEIVQRLF